MGDSMKIVIFTTLLTCFSLFANDKTKHMLSFGLDGLGAVIEVIDYDNSAPGATLYQLKLAYSYNIAGPLQLSTIISAERIEPHDSSLTQTTISAYLGGYFNIFLDKQNKFSKALFIGAFFGHYHYDSNSSPSSTAQSLNFTLGKRFDLARSSSNIVFCYNPSISFEHLFSDDFTYHVNRYKLNILDFSFLF